MNRDVIVTPIYVAALQLGKRYWCLPGPLAQAFTCRAFGAPEVRATTIENSPANHRWDRITA